MSISPTSIESQYERTADDLLRVLVVGAGIAGVAVAQLLRHAGWHPVLVERSRNERPPGYMLALMPMSAGPACSRRSRPISATSRSRRR